MAKKSFDVSIKKTQVMNKNCSIPAGYERLSSVLSSLPVHEDNAAAKEAGLKECAPYLNFFGEIAFVQEGDALGPGIIDKIASARIKEGEEGSAVKAAYSVRLLKRDYTGPLLKVRRTSDSEEKDIPFNLKGELDLDVLTDFVGTSNGVVTVWYDQSGSGFHLKQDVAANQPTIVSSGTVQLLNGKPVVKIDATNDYLTTGDATTGTNTPIALLTNTSGKFSAIGVGLYPTFIGQDFLGHDSGPAGAGFDRAALLLKAVNGTNQTIVKSGGVGTTPTNTFAYSTVDAGYVNAQLVQVNISTGTNLSARVNGTTGTPVTIAAPMDGTATARLEMGARGTNGNPGRAVDIQEALVFADNLTDQVSLIETNINDYFDVF